MVNPSDSSYADFHAVLLEKQFITVSIFIAVTLLISIFIYWGIRGYYSHKVDKEKANSGNYLSIFTQHKILARLFYLLPACFVYWAIDLYITPSPDSEFLVKTIEAIKDINEVVIFFIITLSVNSVISALFQHFNNLPYFKDKPLKGYGQVAKIFVWISFFIIIISVLLHKSPTGFFTGLGALSALLMFVFKDTILGFMSGILLTSNDIVREGDWVELPQFEVSGTVFSISISTVKIRAFDNTILTIPTQDIVTSHVKNWRGMYAAGARRIQRHIYIDINTIQYCSDELITKLNAEEPLKSVFQAQMSLSTKENILFKNDLTNISLFRAYIKYYLSQSLDYRHDMDIFVRELQPTTDGLPVEIYVFTTTTDWHEYEEIQARLFDHVYSMLPLFKLRAFQNETDVAIYQANDKTQ